MGNNAIKGIDLFAGLGGFTEAGEQAGINMVWAANHWQLAVDFHKLNHPTVDTKCQDLHQTDWRTVPAHDILLASPACQRHTHAQGKELAHYDDNRATAWAVVSALEIHRTQLAVVENVTGFLKWSLYPAWQMALETLGYSIAPYILDAADFSVPQHRERLFLAITRSRAPVQLHFEPKEHVSIGQYLEWDNYTWSPINKEGRSLNTVARAARGRREQGDRFVMPYYGSGSGLTGRSIHRPLGTVTTRDRWALVKGDWMRMLQPTEYRAAMGFPDTYQLPKVRKKAIHLLGNAICPAVGRDFINQLLKTA